MRTLKKTLALVLVIAMVASFGVIGASADFADVEDTNDYYEAIQVLSGLGIIEGTDDEANTFEPEGTLTREQAAKIVAYVRLGNNAAIVESTDTAPFTDVAANRWSAGFIGYCANLKIVEGEDAGIYNPEGTLTTAAFAKMLLVAIGFDADANDLNGGNWAINTATCAANAGLYIDSIGISATKPITRAQACELALAALQYSSTGSTSNYVIKDANGKVLYTGNDELLALAAYSKAGADGTIEKETVNTGSLGSTNYGLTEGTSTDAFGRASKVWTNGKSGSKLVVYAKFGSEPIEQYTSATTLGKIAAALGYTTYDDEVSLTVITNGEAAEAVTVNKYNTTPIGATGTLIEIYKTGTDAYNVIVVETFVTELQEADIVAATKDSKDGAAAPAYIKIDGLEYETDAFEEGDVVLYTKTTGEGAKIVSVAKADAFSGSVTATAAGYFRVDGAQKYVSANNADTPVLGTTPGYKVSELGYTYFTDFYGNVIKAVQGEVAEVETDYIYVISKAARASSTTGGDGLYESGSSTAAAAQAQVIDLATGEIKVVNLGIVKTNSGYFYANANGSANTKEPVVTTNGPVAVGKIQAYATLSDGSIVLVKDAATQKVELAKGKATVGIDGLYANSATELKVVEYTVSNGAIASASVTKATGIANFPEVTYEAAVVSNNARGLVSSILVVKEKGAVAAAVNYAIYGGAGEYTADGQAHLFYVNGEAKNYIVADGFVAPAEGAVVALSLSDGVVTKAETQYALTAEAVKVTAVESTFFVAGGNVYYFADSYEVIDSEDMSVSTLEAGDTIEFYGKADAVAFIVK